MGPENVKETIEGAEQEALVSPKEWERVLSRIEQLASRMQNGVVKKIEKAVVCTPLLDQKLSPQFAFSVPFNESREMTIACLLLEARRLELHCAEDSTTLSGMKVEAEINGNRQLITDNVVAPPKKEVDRKMAEAMRNSQAPHRPERISVMIREEVLGVSNKSVQSLHPESFVPGDTLVQVPHPVIIDKAPKVAIPPEPIPTTTAPATKTNTALGTTQVSCPKPQPKQRPVEIRDLTAIEKNQLSAAMSRCRIENFYGFEQFLQKNSLSNLTMNWPAVIDKIEEICTANGLPLRLHPRVSQKLLEHLQKLSIIK